MFLLSSMVACGFAIAFFAKTDLQCWIALVV